MLANRSRNLLSGAFAPFLPIKNEAEKQELLNWFNNEPPFYADNLKGSYTENYIFTEEENLSVNAFNAQLSIVIQKIINCPLITLQQIYRDNFFTFYQRMACRNFYNGQTNEFYQVLKIELEEIALKLYAQGPSLRNEKLIKQLADEVLACSPGIFNYIKKVHGILTAKENITSWLAEFRTNNIVAYASFISEKHKIPLDLEIHVENIFLKRALQNNWYPLGFEKFTAMKELHANLIDLDEDDLQAFDRNQLERYTAESIMECIANNFYRCIRQQVNRKAIESKQNLDKLIVLSNVSDLLDGLPFCERENQLESFFDVKENLLPTSDSPLFTCADYYFYLKPLSQFMKLLTKFVFEDELELFNIMSIVERDKLVILVPQENSLCGVHTQKNSFVEQVSPQIISIDTLRYLQLPIPESFLNYYINQGRRKFNDCLIEDVDFRRVNIKKLQFIDSKLINIKVSPYQYIYLFKMGAKIGMLNFNMNESDDEIVKKEISYYLHLGKTEDIGILIFYAIANRNIELLKVLLKLDHNPLLKNAANQIAVEFAAENHAWECIAIFVENKKIIKQQEKIYSQVAAITLMANQEPLFIDIMKAGAAFDAIIDVNGNTLLHLAVRQRALKAIYELSKRSNKFIRNANGEIPFQAALRNARASRDWSIVEVLVRCTHPLERNKFSNLYGDALILALYARQLPLIKVLIEKGACVTKFNSSGNLPLHLAAGFEAREYLKILLPVALETRSQKNKQQKTPIMIATNLALSTGNWDNVWEFTKYNTDEKDKACYGFALQIAAQNSKWQLAKCLLFVNASLTWFQSDNHKTCLHYATKSASIEVVTLFLKKEASIFKADNSGQTPLDIAIHRKNADILTALLYTPSEFTGNISLHAAIKKPHEIPKILALDTGVLKIKNHNGLTPIAFAAAIKEWDAIKACLVADTDKDDSFDLRFAIKNAVFYHQWDLVLMLAKRKAPLNWTVNSENITLLKALVKEHQVNVLYKLLAEINTISEADKAGAFELALNNQDWACVETIVRFKSNDIQFDIYDKALLLASRAQKWSLVKLLIEKKSIVNSYLVKEHQNSLHDAAYSNHPEMISLLLPLAVSDNVNMLNCENKTPLEIAIEKGHWRCVKVFLRDERIVKNLASQPHNENVPSLNNLLFNALARYVLQISVRHEPAGPRFFGVVYEKTLDDVIDIFERDGKNINLLLTNLKKYCDTLPNGYLIRNTMRPILLEQIHKIEQVRDNPFVPSARSLCAIL